MIDEDPVLNAVRAGLMKTYGERIERAVVFGSRVRGQARPDSDYDVAVFLYDFGDRFQEVRRLADLQVSIMDAHNVFIDVMPFAAGSWAERTQFMHDIRHEGLDL